MTAVIGWSAGVVAAVAAAGLVWLKLAPCPGCASGHAEAGEA